MAALTPMMAQYQEMKKNYPDAVLFFRLGDFYEMFFEDAVEVSRVLQLTLTARSKGDNKAPMCGVPYHAAPGYIAKLTRLGKKVAICEQLSDPNLPGIVKRDVVRVITPGTTLDDQVLEQKSNNYLLAVVHVSGRAEGGSAAGESKQGGRFGLAYADISTGELRTTELASEQELFTELERIHPTEALMSSEMYASSLPTKLSDRKLSTFFFEHNFHGDAEGLLKEHFGLQSLDGFGLNDLDAATAATALVLDYLKQTQKTSLAHIQGIQLYHASNFMPLDEATLKNLELLSTLREGKREGSLLWVLDETVTSMGGRYLKFVITHPLLDLAQIHERLEGVDEFTQNQIMLDDIREVMQGVLDLERLLARLSLGYGNARDLLALKKSLMSVPYLQSILMSLGSEIFARINSEMDSLPDLTALIERAIVEEPPLAVKDGGMIKEGYHSELDELKKISHDGKSVIQEMQKKEIESTGINSLKIRYNSVFGYYIEVSKTNLAAVPAHYIRKQTLVNAERFITPELKEYEEKVLGAEEKITALEYQLFCELREKVVAEISRIQKLAQAIAQLDVVSSFAKVALQYRYHRPKITDAAVIKIEAGRHPVIEKISIANQFVPNDVDLNHETNQLLLITGPNMGGKSTFLRQTALIVLMAHLGSFVPAASAEIGLTDRIFTRVGASDNLVKGQSTFMVEMQETAFILQNATAKSLIILDEIGRGTSTYDGMSIAWSILEYLHDKVKAKTLFASHYHELIALAEKLPSAQNFSVAVRENEQEGVIFLYKIVKGGVDRSYGIEVAKLAGLPHEVVTKAKQILNDLEEGVLEQGIHQELNDATKRVPEDQLGMFSARVDAEDMAQREQRPLQILPKNKALEELETLDVNHMTPLEALQKLAEIQKKM